MKRTPTDIEYWTEFMISYYDEFSSFSKDKPNRQNKTFIPIDIERIASQLNVDVDIVFGGCIMILKRDLAIKTMMA